MGLVLASVNSVPVQFFNQAMLAIKTAGRPLTLGFQQADSINDNNKYEEEGENVQNQNGACPLSVDTLESPRSEPQKNLDEEDVCDDPDERATEEALVEASDTEEDSVYEESAGGEVSPRRASPRGSTVAQQQEVVVQTQQQILQEEQEQEQQESAESLADIIAHSAAEGAARILQQQQQQQRRQQRRRRQDGDKEDGMRSPASVVVSEELTGQVLSDVLDDFGSSTTGGGEQGERWRWAAAQSNRREESTEATSRGWQRRGR